MKFNKLALVTAVSAAVGGMSGIANAQITGLPGESLLVPMVLSGSLDGVPLETYVGLYVPQKLGKDTVINRYTAPHTSPGVQKLPENPTIHWTLFDEHSVEVDNGYCEVSPGDKTVWTTDQNYQAQQVLQRRGLIDAGVTGKPDPFCGPSLPTTRFGYVVFQTVEGGNGNNADFAFWGNAWILDNGVIGPANSIASVPVLPMADGYDESRYEHPHLGNEVISSDPTHDKDVDTAPSPAQVAPIAAGIRMNDATPPEDMFVTLQAEIRGPVTGSEMSLHVFWFDKENENRVATMEIWDDQEEHVSDRVELPRELNLLLYNYSVVVNPGFNAATWANLPVTGRNRNGGLTDVISAVKDPNGYVNGSYNQPKYWNAVAPTYPGALNGYVQYKLKEEGTGIGIGLVDEAAAAFNWQESLDTQKNVANGTNVESGWSSHMTTDLGKQ